MNYNFEVMSELNFISSRLWHRVTFDDNRLVIFLNRHANRKVSNSIFQIKGRGTMNND